MRVTLALSVAAVLGLGASAASAQGSPDGFVFGSVRFQPDLSMRPDQQKPKIPEPKPKSPPSARSQPRATQPATPAFTISGVVDLGLVSFASAQPIEALYDTANGLMWGGGVRVAHRSGLFARVTAYHFSKQGERVFVSSGQVFKLGIPTTLTIVPLDITGGWRFLPKQRAARPVPPPKPPATGKPGTTASPEKPGRQPPRTAPARTSQPSRRTFVPYLGGGIGFVSVKEKGDFATSSDNVDEQHTSYHVLGGVEYPLSKLFGVGVEGGWRWVPKGLEGSGVAQEFDQTDLNHFFLMARFTIGR